MRGSVKPGPGPAGKRWPWVSGRGSPDAGGRGSKAPRLRVQRSTAMAASNRRTVGQGSWGGTPQAEGAGAAAAPAGVQRQSLWRTHCYAVYKCALAFGFGVQIASVRWPLLKVAGDVLQGVIIRLKRLRLSKKQQRGVTLQGCKSRSRFLNCVRMADRNGD